MISVRQRSMCPLHFPAFLSVKCCSMKYVWMWHVTVWSRELRADMPPSFFFLCLFNPGGHLFQLAELQDESSPGRWVIFWMRAIQESHLSHIKLWVWNKLLLGQATDILVLFVIIVYVTPIKFQFIPIWNKIKMISN